MNKTKIEWALNPDGTPGYTWNPITGCLNDCVYCYARRLANTRLRERYLANKNVAPLCFDDSGNEKIVSTNTWEQAYDPFYPRFWEDRLDDVLHRKIDSPLRGIFTCDMSDLFGIGIPEEWTRQVLGAIETNFYDRFYLLTKQPQNLQKFSPFPDNCFVGVSATDNTSLDKAMVGLADIKANKRYLSFEPLLLPVNFSEEDAELLDWVIIGAVTGTKQELLNLKVSADLTLMPYGNKWTLRPKIEGVKEIVEACDKAGVAVFLKDNLRDLLVPDALMNDIFWENEKAKLRQEVPNA